MSDKLQFVVFVAELLIFIRLPSHTIFFVKVIELLAFDQSPW